jgi:hypothetical protein
LKFVSSGFGAITPHLVDRKFCGNGGNFPDIRTVVVDGTARPAGSTRVTWGQPEVGDRPARETDPHV